MRLRKKTRALRDLCGTWAQRRDGVQAPRAGWLSGYPNAHQLYYPRRTWWGQVRPFGRPVVPEVYRRLGLGATETSGSSSLLRRAMSTSLDPSKFVRQPMTVGTPASARLRCRVPRFRGRQRACGSPNPRECRRLPRRSNEVDWNHGRSAD